MEGPIGDRIVLAVAPIAYSSVFGAPPRVVEPDVQPKKYVGRKKPALGDVDVDVCQTLPRSLANVCIGEVSFTIHVRDPLLYAQPLIKLWITLEM